MKRISHAVFLAAMFSTCAVAQQAPVQQTLVGRWEWTNPEKKCREVMEFQPNGTVVLYSGAGRFDGTYDISPRPSARGLYRLTMKTPKSATPRKDCSGAEEELAETESGYVWVDPVKDMFMFCDEDNFSFCTAPLRRIR